jgi:hypothetical protein
MELAGKGMIVVTPMILLRWPFADSSLKERVVMATNAGLDIKGMDPMRSQ